MASEQTKIKIYKGNLEMNSKLQNIFSKKEKVEIEKINEINCDIVNNTDILIILSEEDRESILNKYKKAKIFIVALNGIAFYCYSNGDFAMSVLNRDEERSANVILDQYYACKE